MIDSRFRGPSASANGGYACGVVARAIAAPCAEVTLRVPPPLDRQLEIRADGERATLHDGELLVAEGEAATPPRAEVPPPLEVELAAAASAESPLHRNHPFPECFTCGPNRGAGDGLRVIPGPVAGRDDIVAASWEVDRSLPSDGRAVDDEIVWAALDCPSGNALLLVDDVGTSLLGRLRAELLLPVEVGRSYVALGWPVERDGRKNQTGSAIFTADGELVAHAEAIWIELRDQPDG